MSVGEIIASKEFKIFITFFLIYAFFIGWQGFFENSIFFQTQAIVDKGTLQIDEYANQTTDRSLFNNHFYSDKSPGISFLLIPFYWLTKLIVGPIQAPTGAYLTFNEAGANIFTYINLGFKANASRIVGVLFGSTIFASLSLVLIYRTSSFFTKKENLRFFITLISGFATPIFYFGTYLFDTSASIFFFLLSFYLFFDLYRTKSKSQLKLILLGLCLGFSIVVNILLSSISFFFLFFLFIRDRKKIFLIIIGFLVGVSPLLTYNILAFGTPFTFTKFYYDTTASASNYQSHIFSPFDPFIGATRGIITYFPIFLLAILGGFLMLKNFKLEFVAIIFPLISIVLFLSFYSYAFNILFGGVAFVSRTLVPFVIPLVFPLIFAFDFLRKSKWRYIAYALIAYSLLASFTSLTGLTYDFIGKSFPFFDYYLPNFINSGPRSRILESMLTGGNFDIRFSTFSDREQFSFLHSTSYSPFLPIFFVFLILSLIWIKNLKWKIGISGLIILIFLLYFYFWPSIFEFDKSGVILEDGFYSKLPTENVTWMTNTGKIIIKENTTHLNLMISPAIQNKHLSIYLNNILYSKILLQNDTTILYKVKLNQTSRNEILLRTDENCIIPATVPSLNMSDTRCFGLSINSTEFKNQ